MADATGGASTRAVIDTPIRGAIEVIVETGATAASEARAESAPRDAAAAGVTATVVASAGVIKIDASALQNAVTMSPARKARAIVAKAAAAKEVVVAKVAVATETATAAISTGPMEIVWKQATARLLNPAATTTSEIGSTQRQRARPEIPAPKVRSAAANGRHTDPRVENAVMASSAAADVVAVEAGAAAGVVAPEKARPLPTELSQVIANTPKDPSGAKELASTAATLPTATITTQDTARARTSILTIVESRSRAAAVAIASLANLSSREDHRNRQAPVRVRSNRASRSSTRVLRMSRASSARTIRERHESHRAAVSHHLACHRTLVSHQVSANRLRSASHPRNARRQRPESRQRRAAHPSLASHHNHVSPHPPPSN